MGPCQGRLCAEQLRTIAERVTPEEAARVGQPTTLRPPVRPLRLEEAAAGARHHIERHTALHEKHLAAGATTMWAGPWKRIEAYHGDVDGEYWAVRQRVGMIDVGTLGKFLVAGPDVVEFLERIYPMRVADLEPGRLRYGLLLEEGGVIIDDGTVCAMEGGSFYLTVTTSGAERLESWMLDWRDAWGLEVFVVTQTRRWGPSTSPGPTRASCCRSSRTIALDKQSFPYLRHRRITVAGVPCLAMRLGFVGELAYELHFPASRSEELWTASWTRAASGTSARSACRRSGSCGWRRGTSSSRRTPTSRRRPGRSACSGRSKLDKPDFVGKAALLRAEERTPRELLVPWQMAPGTAAPPEGATVKVGGQLAGRVTSSWFSPVLGHPLGLAWVTSASAKEGASVLIDNAPATSPAMPCTTRRE